MNIEQRAKAYLQEIHNEADRQSQDGRRWHTVLRIRAPHNAAEGRVLENWRSNFVEIRGEALHIEFTDAE